MRMKYPRPIVFIATLLGFALPPSSVFSQVPFYQGKLAKIIREMPRDPEVVDMLKKFSGVDPLPSR